MFYYHKGNQLSKTFTTTRAPSKTNVLLLQGHPTKQMYYDHKGTQLNKCFTTTRVPNKTNVLPQQG